MMKKATKKESPKEKQSQKFAYDIIGGSDIEQARAKIAIQTSADEQGFELGDFHLEETFNPELGSMTYRMVATGHK